MKMNDLEQPNLFVGKKIGDSALEAEVLTYYDDGMAVKITQLKDKYFERYLDLGGVYALIQHKHWQGNLLLWEVKPEMMKRQVSQILLQWEKDIGWTWDLDS